MTVYTQVKNNSTQTKMTQRSFVRAYSRDALGGKKIELVPKEIMDWDQTDESNEERPQI